MLFTINEKYEIKAYNQALMGTCRYKHINYTPKMEEDAEDAEERVNISMRRLCCDSLKWRWICRAWLVDCSEGGGEEWGWS